MGLGARSRQCYKAVQHVVWRAGAWQELTAAMIVMSGVSGPDRRCRQRSDRGDLVDEFGIEVAQDVIAASSELASDGDRGELSVVSGLDREDRLSNHPNGMISVVRMEGGQGVA